VNGSETPQTRFCPCIRKQKSVVRIWGVYYWKSIWGVYYWKKCTFEDSGARYWPQTRFCPCIRKQKSLVRIWGVYYWKKCTFEFSGARYWPLSRLDSLARHAGTPALCVILWRTLLASFSPGFSSEACRYTGALCEPFLSSSSTSALCVSPFFPQAHLQLIILHR
jgi:hypothetical protein